MSTDKKNKIWSIIFINNEIEQFPLHIRLWFTALALLILFFFVSTSLILMVISTFAQFESGGSDSLRNHLLAVAAVFGVPFIIWRSWIAHRQAESTQEQVTLTSATLAATTYAKSIELLGSFRQVNSITDVGSREVIYSENIEARIGALYSLEGLAKGRRMDASVVYDTICAYVRANAPIFPDEYYESGHDHSFRLDIQVALDVIGRQDYHLRECLNDDKLDLSRCDLLRYKMHNKDFRGCSFNESYIPKFINNSDFDKSTFLLTGLHGRSFLSCSMVSVYIEGIPDDMSFRGCNMSDALLAGSGSPSFISCDLSHARLDELYELVATTLIDYHGQGKLDLFFRMYSQNISNLQKLFKTCDTSGLTYPDKIRDALALFGDLYIASKGEPEKLDS